MTQGPVETAPRAARTRGSHENHAKPLNYSVYVCTGQTGATKKARSMCLKPFQAEVVRFLESRDCTVVRLVA